jgi:hypothetical protein
MAYKITILSLGGHGSVEAYLPDEIMVSAEHRWENPFEVNMSQERRTGLQWAGNLTGTGITGNFDPSVVGNPLGIDTFTYMGSAPISMQLELEFIVNRSIEEDVVLPVKKLMKMGCPKSAGLSTLMTLGKPDLVQVVIPGVLYINKAYLTNVGVNLMKPLVTDGSRTTPQRVRMPITLIKAEILTTDRSDEMFFNK